MTAMSGRPVTVAVIGAGMSGLNMAIQLRRAGIESFTVFEKAASVGGTWRENRYPGLTCDVPAQWYTYSYEPNPEWTHRFARGPEIRQYFERVARKYNLLPKIRFGTEIVEASFGDSRWTLKTRTGEVHSADVLVAATGVLHHPSVPQIEGLDAFGGDSFHSARWPDGLSLKGRRIGIIGSGSTALQILPAIVEEVRNVHLFQRTPSWILPVPDRRYSGLEKAVLRRVPALSHLSYDVWDRMFTVFADNSLGTKDGSSRLQPYVRYRCLQYLKTVKDPGLRRKLTPDYAPMCKRLVISTSFYEAIQHPNASLETAGIERVLESGLLLKDGRKIDLDVLVLATGFHAHNYIRPARVTGRDGVRLDDVWSGSLRNYLSLAIPGFPNLFFMIGPNSPIGN